MPHQREVVHMLQYSAQAAHDLVPPDAMEPVVRQGFYHTLSFALYVLAWLISVQYRIQSICILWGKSTRSHTRSLVGPS